MDPGFLGCCWPYCCWSVARCWAGRGARTPRGPGPATVNVPAETAAMRDELQQAMRAYRLGDHVPPGTNWPAAPTWTILKNMEIPLRALNPDLTAEMEFRFARLRSAMDDRARSARSRTTRGWCAMGWTKSTRYLAGDPAPGAALRVRHVLLDYFP